MTAVREQYTNIVGVDTHARTNTYVIVAAATGQVVDTATFPTSPPGLQRAIAWIGRRREVGKTLVAIEGTNSYGAGLTRALRATELDICEVRPPRRDSRAGRGKSDDIDALAAARTVLSEDMQTLLEPRAEGIREALRILLNARDAMVRQSTADRLMLTSMLRTMDLGVDARKALTNDQVMQVSRWRTHRDDDLSARIARAEAKRLATAIIEFTPNWHRTTSSCRRSSAPWHRASWTCRASAPCPQPRYSSHTHTTAGVRSEAAFAALAGASPIPASSGNKTRHRLNRHGDRQLNRALHIIARTRMMFDATTIAYVGRRTAEGKSLREIRRCIKRFIARQLFRKLQTLLT